MHGAHRVHGTGHTSPAVPTSEHCWKCKCSCRHVFLQVDMNTGKLFARAGELYGGYNGDSAGMFSSFIVFEHTR